MSATNSDRSSFFNPRRARPILGATLASLLVLAGCADDTFPPPPPPGTGGGGQGGAGMGGGGEAGGGETGGGGSGEAGGGQGGAGGGQGGGGQGGGQAGSMNLQVLAINDFHGNLEPPAGGGGQITLPDSTKVTAGGAAYLATHIAALRAQNPHTVVVSAGDLIGGTPLVSALFHDEPTIEAMNMIGLDFNGVGNHEFDKGTAELLRMQYGGCSPIDGCQDGTFFPGANFQFLAANVVVDEANNKTLFAPYEIREFEGVKVAFIGMTLEGTPTIVTPIGISGLVFRDEVQTVNALVPELQAQGVESIVVLLHEGGYPTGFYNECPGISGPVVDIATAMDPAVDVIVSGHTHQAYNCVVAGKVVTSAASSGRIVTDLDLQIDKGTGDVTAVTANNVIVTRDMADPVVAAFVDEYKMLAAPLANTPIGLISADLLRTPSAGGAGLSQMGLVIADSQLEATQEQALGGAQIAFMNPGGVRADLLYAASGSESSDGIVTYGEAFTVQPFGNSLVVMTLTGAQIEMLLEQQFYLDASGMPKATILQVSQGFSYSYSTSAPIGNKVDPASIMLNGTALDPAQSYRVTVNSFMASGGDGFTVLPQGTDRLGGVVDLEALEAYFGNHAPVAPPATDRITVLP